MWLWNLVVFVDYSGRCEVEICCAFVLLLAVILTKVLHVGNERLLSVFLKTNKFLVLVFFSLIEKIRCCSG